VGGGKDEKIRKAAEGKRNTVVRKLYREKGCGLKRALSAHGY